MLSEVRAGFIPALPRVPLSILMQVVAFFRHFIHCGSEYEALVNIYWDKEAQEFIADVPEQVVTGVSVDSHISGEFMDERYIHYMDIHSHNTMGAFFSPVDDHDEKATRLYAVVGRLDKAVPEMKVRISNGGKFLDIDPSLVFEPAGTSFPDDWKGHVSINSHSKRDIRKAMRIARLEKKLRKKAGVL